MSGISRVGPSADELLRRGGGKAPWAQGRVSGPPVQKDTTPRGGPVPSVPIPDLESQPVQGHTMAEIALARRQAAGVPYVPAVMPPAESPQPTPGSIVDEPSRRQMAQQPAQQQVATQGQVRRVVSAQQAAARPLAASLADMNALLTANQAAPQSSQQEEPVTAPPAEPTDKEKAEAFKEAVEKLDDFDFEKLQQLSVRDNITSDEQRTLIESRLKALSLDELITSGRVSQVVPIVPGVLEYTFMSTSGEEDLGIKQLLSTQIDGIEVSQLYFRQKFSIMSMAAGLHAVNNNPMPGQFDKEGNFDLGMFAAKLKKVLRFNLHMLASLITNQVWFEMRVRRLFEAKKLGNG